MPIEVNWDDEAHTRLRYDFVGEWSWTEFRSAIQQAYDLIGTVSHPVDTIANFKNSNNLPGGAMSQVKRGLTEGPPNVADLYVANGSAFINTMANVLARVYSDLASRVFITKTLEDARAMSEEKRAR